MTATPLDDDVRALLLEPNPCVMATLRKDGSPVSVPTWYRLVGDQIQINLETGRAWTRGWRSSGSTRGGTPRGCDPDGLATLLV